MKIYTSTEYFERDKQTETYYQLSVTSQWDFSVKSICYKNLEDGTLIGYNLRQGNPWKQITIDKVTDEIREELERMGYRMADKK